jgi:DNA-binding XRE family transcriptional regulator
MKKKWDRSTMRFASVRYIARKGMLDVTFENGDHFLVDTESVLARVNQDGGIGWREMRISETGDVLEVPGPGELIEIPWDRIRSLADAKFRAHLTNASIQRARRLGLRIRTLRRAAKMTRLEIARKTGLSRDEVANLEAGKVEPTLDLIEHIALALGKRMRDFAVQQRERPERSKKPA